MNQTEKRVRQWVRLIWIEKGRPTGREQDFLRVARELVMIEERENISLQPAPKAAARSGHKVPVVASRSTGGDEPSAAAG